MIMFACQFFNSACNSCNGCHQCCNFCNSEFFVRKLISNQPGIALHLDTDLVDSWGILIIKSIMYVADNGTGLVTTYDLNGNKLPTTFTVNLTNSSPGNPSGLVHNSTLGFVVTEGINSAPSTILIATENGTINGWNPAVDPLHSFVLVDNSGSSSVYKGLTIVGTNLYAADFFNKKIDVFNSALVPITSFPFQDLDTSNPIPATFAPFNIVEISDCLYVLYAKQSPPDNTDDLAGPGNGYVSVFRFDGTFVKRLISNGKLNSPWAIVPIGRCLDYPNGSFLIGNFGDGKFNVYDRCGR